MKRSFLLLASFLAITIGGVFILFIVAHATLMDPSIKGDYWLRVLGRLGGRDFLPGVVLAVIILLLGVLLGLEGLGISFGRHAPRLNEASFALWLSVALVAVLLCCLVALWS